MTPNDIASLANSARKQEEARILKSPIVAPIVAERDALRAEVAELKARLAEPPKNRSKK